MVLKKSISLSCIYIFILETRKINSVVLVCFVLFCFFFFSFLGFFLKQCDVFVMISED